MFRFVEQGTGDSGSDGDGVLFLHAWSQLGDNWVRGSGGVPKSVSLLNGAAAKRADEGPAACVVPTFPQNAAASKDAADGCIGVGLSTECDSFAKWTTTKGDGAGLTHKQTGLQLVRKHVGDVEAVYACPAAVAASGGSSIVTRTRVAKEFCKFCLRVVQY